MFQSTEKASIFFSESHLHTDAKVSQSETKGQVNDWPIMWMWGKNLKCYQMDKSKLPGAVQSGAQECLYILGSQYNSLY